MTTAVRPPITPRGEEKVFYDRLREHELVFHRCDGCSSVVFPLRTVCPHCSSESLSIEVSRGAGVVYSFTTQHRAAHPFFADDVPTTLVLVDLDEGFRVFANLTGVENVVVGAAVEAWFDDVDAELTLLRFRPRNDAAGEGRA